MGMIGDMFGFLFGGGRNVVAETAEVFRVNAEAADRRAHEATSTAMGQLAAEFAQPQLGWYDRFINGLNRLPRPMMALGTLGLIGSAMVDPVWFAERMVGIALVPEPLWWLMGAIVSFYFGARYQTQGQAFQRSIAETMARVPEVTANLAELQAMTPGPVTPTVADAAPDAEATAAAITPTENPALDEWRARAA